MSTDLYLHSSFRFDTLAEAACFLSGLAEVDEKHASFVEAQPTVEHAEDSGELILQSRSSSAFS